MAIKMRGTTTYVLRCEINKIQLRKIERGVWEDKRKRGDKPPKKSTRELQRQEGIVELLLLGVDGGR
jgi:hypothetical protein